MNAETYLSRGRDLLAASEPRKALEHFRDGLEAHPDHLELRLGVGLAFNALGDYATACEVLGKLCETHPAWEEPRLAIIEALLRRKRPSAALAMARWGFGDARKNAEFVLTAADMFLAKGLGAEGAELYAKALEYAPDSSRAALGLGRCHKLEGRAEAALEALRKAVELDVQNWAAYQELGLLLYEQERKPEAKAALDMVPVDAVWEFWALKRLISMCWRAPDRAKRRRLQDRLEHALDHETSPREEGKWLVRKAEARMDELSAQRYRAEPSHEGGFWRGIPTIVPQGEGFDLDSLYRKMFLKPCRFEKGGRPQLRRLDKHLFDQTVDKLAAFLEGYPWNTSKIPPTEQMESAFEYSGVTELMLYGAAMLKGAAKLINVRLVDRVGLLRLKRAAAHLEAKVPLGEPAHRAWLELAAALQSWA